MAAFAQDHVGGKVCGECHAQAYTAWRGSHHDLAMQVADERTVLGNFAQAKFTYAGTTSSFFRRDGRFVVRTDGPDGKLADYPVKYTFGVYPLQQYLIELPGGRLQALSIAWDTRPKAAGGQRWFHMYPGQGIKAGDPLHWTGIGQNWNFMCSECHSTNLRKNFDAKSGEFHTTWAEVNVSCEACHGPGARHVTWARSGADGRTADKGLALALDERKGATWAADATTGQPRRSVPRTSAREVETCARCHARGSRISDDYVHGKPLLDTHRTALLEDSLYWVDGQMRDEVYNWGSFLQSRMNAAGVTCSDCHDPHTLKLRAAGNALCAQCHAPAKYDAPTHTHHASNTAAGVLRRVPHAGHDVHGRRSEARSFVSHSAARPKCGARNAERVQRLSFEADRGMGLERNRQVDGSRAERVPDLRRIDAERRDRCAGRPRRVDDDRGGQGTAGRRARDCIDAARAPCDAGDAAHVRESAR